MGQQPLPKAGSEAEEPGVGHMGEEKTAEPGEEKGALEPLKHEKGVAGTGGEQAKEGQLPLATGVLGGIDGYIGRQP